MILFPNMLIFDVITNILDSNLYLFCEHNILSNFWEIVSFKVHLLGLEE